MTGSSSYARVQCELQREKEKGQMAVNDYYGTLVNAMRKLVEADRQKNTVAEHSRSLAYGFAVMALRLREIGKRLQEARVASSVAEKRFNQV